MRALITSRMPAASRTERATQPSMVPPAHPSPTSGPCDTRPRVGFSPTRPHSLAGMRMEPPPSLACATATMPLATVAADPPEDPPAEWPGFHGLRAGGEPPGPRGGVGPHPGPLV